MLTDFSLRGLPTCRKVFRREVIQRNATEEKRCGFEPEAAANALLPKRGSSAGTSIAFVTAAALNDVCVKPLFRHQAEWHSETETLTLLAVVVTGSIVDLYSTRPFMMADLDGHTR